MDVASFLNRFCNSLDYPRLVGLATTGHIRSLMTFSVNVITKYTNSIKVSNHIRLLFISFILGCWL